ncbi:MAG: hypothetical protein HY575_01990 [candidate division NC10 bacterium]|nr:hypothetical protein [candidate division NC10 bacterium]
MGSEAAEARAALTSGRDALRAVLAELDAYLATLRPVLGREIPQIFAPELAAVADAVQALTQALEGLGDEHS